MITGNKRKRFSVLLIRLGGEFIWGTGGIYIRTTAVGKPTGSPKSIFPRFWTVLWDLSWGHLDDLGDLNGGSR